MTSKSKKKIVLIILICLAACGAGILVWYGLNLAMPTSGGNGASSRKLVDNPVDFDSLHAENVDAFGWLVVEGTDVDTVVAQSATDDEYYLHHDLNGNYTVAGIPFMEMQNSVDMTDAVSVIYGHNLVDGTEFTTLHYFENAEFFEENDTFTIYIPEHILTYEVISAYVYDDRHILNSYDFDDAEVLQSYFDFVCNPTSLVANVRYDDNGEPPSLTAGVDRIVQLSTCMSGVFATSQRYIVTGRLVDDQPTYR